MKKIFSIFLTATAALAFAPAVLAQDDWSIDGQITPKLSFPIENGVHQASDFAYSKDISEPQPNGTYWIKLESFSTGSATYIESAAPADIVLVLDVSSSMVNNYIYKAVETPEGGWNYTNINSGGPYYVRYNNRYYQVERGGNTNSRYIRFRTGGGGGGNYRYLWGTGTQNSQPTGTIGDNTSIYTGTLYTRETRLAALKRATCDFIKVIEINDKYEDEAGTIERKINGVPTRLGNRISIVTFSSSANVIVSLQDGELKDVSTVDPTKSTSEYLQDQVNGFTNGTGTRPDLGINQANDQFKNYVSAARMKIASRTVVVFTDGEPYPNNNNENYNTAIASALKSKTKDDPETTTEVEGYDATVFTVGLFSSTPADDSNLWTFMNYMSSNAPKAASMSTSATDAGFDKTKGYYKDASAENADLSAVFTEIAHQSGGSSTSLSAGSSNVDVVSNSFKLPDGTNTTNIQNVVKIFVAKLKEIDANGEYVFYTEYLKGHTPDDYVYYPIDEDGNISETAQKVDPNISVALEGTNTIKVTGFDYSSCYCGPVYEEGWDPKNKTWAENRPHVESYQGYKIIIMIPIKMNPDTVGGPNCATNDKGSGIYIHADDKDAFIKYESPTVSLPVNVYIEKRGLEGRESAKFIIESALIPETENWKVTDITKWDYVSTVFVTNSPNTVKSKDGYPMVRVKGMPATKITGYKNAAGEVVAEKDETHTIPVQRGLIYRITEENWSWSYTPGTAPQYTVTDKIDNPFTYGNTKKDRIDIEVRHSESKATNIFNASGSIQYDDAKKNAGREQYYTPPTTGTSSSEGEGEGEGEGE